MKHYFIINPAAGPKDKSTELAEMIETVYDGLDYELYFTKGYKDATIQAKKIASNLTEDTIFYACGGDGTSYEVINGIFGYPKAHFSVIPIGSCNDYLKNFKDCNFMDLEKLRDGSLFDIDIIEVNGHYAVNEVNIGYDAGANMDCTRYKKHIKNVNLAYVIALGKNLFKMNRYTKLETEDEVLFDDKSLLIACCNGQYYGGGFRCTPNAIVNDGLFDIVVVKHLSALRFLRMVKYYKKGEHVTHPKLRDIVFYYQKKEVTIKGKKPFPVCIDGENMITDSVKVKMHHKAIKMLMPIKQEEGKDV